MKLCSYCKQEKELTKFYPLAHCSQGVSNICKICNAIAGKKSYENNKQKAKDRAKEWAKNNNERRKEIYRKSAKKNIDKKREYNRLYQKKKRLANPKKEKLSGRAHSLLRRARLKSASTKRKISGIRVDKIIESAKGYCIYCGKKCENLCLDHFTPISKGGKHLLNNIIPCCKSCNSSKWIREPADWLVKKHGENGLKRAIFYLEKKDFLKHWKVHGLLN